MQDKQAEAFEAFNLQKRRLPADVLRAAWEKGGWDAVFAALLREAEATSAREGAVARLRMFHGVYTRDGDGIVDAPETLEKVGTRGSPSSRTRSSTPPAKGPAQAPPLPGGDVEVRALAPGRPLRPYSRAGRISSSPTRRAAPC
jgi:hypothetical protein